MKRSCFSAVVIVVLMFTTKLSAEETTSANSDVEETISASGTEYNVPCIRCDRKYRVDIQLLSLINSPLGFSGISLTKHLLDRTSLQGGIGYGFGGFNVSSTILHYLEKDNPLYILTGVSLTAGKNGSADDNSIDDDHDEDHPDQKYPHRRRRCDRQKTCDRQDSLTLNYLEGLWVNIGGGYDISTQSGLHYGFDFGVSMAVLSNVLSSKIKVCAGAIAHDDCAEPWRILPYLTPLKIGYSF